jgi:dihydroorotate dehydrogenase (NAD+) catalytic subunit
MIKLTPNVTDLVAIATAVADAGADSLSAINTYVGMAIDVRRRRPVLGNGTGGLSGPAIKPLAVRAVCEVAAAVSIPVIGIGGIATADDAIEFLLAGAVAVQLGTINYVNPDAAREVVGGIRRYAIHRAFTDLRPFPLRAAAVPSHA